MNYLADVDQIEPGDSLIHAAPAKGHGSGLYAIPHVARAANNVIPKSGGFRCSRDIALIEHWLIAPFSLLPPW